MIVYIQFLPRKRETKKSSDLWGNDSWIKAMHILNRKPDHIYWQCWQREKDWKYRHWNVFCKKKLD